jgi:uroporphyrinogen decarboxylase
MGQKLAAHFKVAIADLPRVLDNHFVRVDLTYATRLSDNGRVRFDWWGAGHDTREEGHYIPVNPPKDSKDLGAYPWPDPYDSRLLDEAARTIETLGSEYFIAPNFGFALFERAWSLRGFEQIFIDLGARSGSR